MRLIQVKKRKSADRKGTTMVETAVVLPIFFTLIFGFIEFGHCFMTIHTMNAAARRAARLGVAEQASTSEVKQLAKDILGSAINADLEDVKIWVKDATVFDDPDFDPDTDITANFYEDLDDTDVENLDTGNLFIVRIQVPYSQVGILGPRWVTNLNLYGQSVMRKE